MCNTAPLLLYYIYIPAIFVILLLGFFIFLKNYKETLNRLFFALSINLALWMTFNMLSFISSDIDKVLVFDRMMVIGIFAPVILVAIAYFFSKNDYKFSFKKLIAIIFSISPFILFSATKYNIKGETAPPDCSPIPGILYWYIFLFVVFYFVWSLLVFFKAYKSSEENTKKQIKVILFGFGIAIVWALITNVLSVKYDSISLLAPIGIIFLMFSISYSIVQYRFLNIKLIAAQALTVLIWILIGSELFFVQSTTVYILVIFTLILSIIFGIMLIKSIKLEVQRKEELQKMSDSLAVANDKLRQLDQAKTDFVSMVSHQLRRSPTAIKGFTSLILEGSYGKITPQIKDVLEKVYKSNEIQIDFVENLLNISRLESGRVKFEFAKSKIEDLCQDAVDVLALKAKESGLYLDYKKLESPLPEIMVDGGKIREVISNLVDNAIKYTKKGGVKVSLELHNKKVRIVVSDTGIGIPAAEIPYLFSKFSRGKNTTRLDVNGTGLGLYVVKMMTEGNGGKVWVESDGEGKGSRFVVELPIEQSQETIDRYA